MTRKRVPRVLPGLMPSGVYHPRGGGVPVSRHMEWDRGIYSTGRNRQTKRYGVTMASAQRGSQPIRVPVGPFPRVLNIPLHAIVHSGRDSQPGS